MSDQPDSRKPEAPDAPNEAAKPAKRPQSPEPHPLAAMHNAEAEEHADEEAERLKVYLTGPTAFCA
jgi:hypothetical protein